MARAVGTASFVAARPTREGLACGVLELPEQAQMLSWREVAPTMVDQLDAPGHGLKLLSREALAVASLLGAEVIMAAANENHLLRHARCEVGLDLSRGSLLAPQALRAMA